MSPPSNFDRLSEEGVLDMILMTPNEELSQDVWEALKKKVLNFGHSLAEQQGVGPLVVPIFRTDIVLNSGHLRKLCPNFRLSS
jgi:hypothetical protein